MLRQPLYPVQSFLLPRCVLLQLVHLGLQLAQPGLGLLICAGLLLQRGKLILQPAPTALAGQGIRMAVSDLGGQIAEPDQFAGQFGQVLRLTVLYSMAALPTNIITQILHRSKNIVQGKGRGMFKLGDIAPNCLHSHFFFLPELSMVRASARPNIWL